MATDDLSAPLGQTRKKKKRFQLPAFLPHVIAGTLTLCVATFAGWAALVDDPFGGEPVVIVSAGAPASPEAKKSGDAPAPTAARVPDAAVPPTAIAEKAAPPGNTVTIIDGSTGKRHDIQVSGPAGTKAPPPKQIDVKAPTPSAPAPKPGANIDPRLLESSPHGSIPKIASDGTRPADVYARPVKTPPGRADGPKIAIVIGGLGVGANGTSEALAKLPAPVTFAFAPHGTDLDRWVTRARGEGHEVLLQIGMEPFDYPDNDPGPQTLLTSVSPEQNIDRLQWFMSRFQGYVGVSNLMGARFTAADQAFGPVMREIAKRGLIYFDDGSSPRSLASQLSAASNAAFAKADFSLDAVPTAAEIDAALTRLEQAARSRGAAIGIATALPVSIDRIAQWAKAAEARGITLVPISAIANKPKSS